MIVKKDSLEGKVEYYIFNQMKEKEYELQEYDATELLTWNRFIVAFNLLYLDLKDKNRDLAEKIYIEMVRATSLGSFKETGFEETKNNIDIFLKEFENTFNSIKLNGFDSSKSVIPLAKDNSILNGSHRVACAAFLGQKVVCVKTELEPICDDYKNLFDRAVPETYVEMATIKFCEYAKNVHIAFLWPSQKEHMKVTERFFDKVVYKKEIKLTPNGAFNLLFELYKHMDWVGSKENNYIGIQQKLIECFPNFSSFKVIVFQANNIEEVKSIKEKVRNVCKIGYSSIHITDTPEEALRISKLLFNKNGLHFLNYAKPRNFSYVIPKIESFKKILANLQISSNEVVIDGSFVLALYGIRKSLDIDILTESRNEYIFKDTVYDIHDSEVKYHGLNKKDLLWNPEFYFEYMGIKFISFDQLYKMKKNRAETKDINDCEIMEAYLSNNVLKERIVRIRQYILYIRIILLTKARKIISTILKKLKIYEQVKYLYRYTRGKK